MKGAVALLTAVVCPKFFAEAQTTYSVSDCSDFEALPSITTDALIDFTASPISCDTNTNMVVSGDMTLELTSSLDELNLVNIRFGLRSSASLVVSAPNLQWQSEETTEGRTGAALSVSEGCTATFNEAVTFAGCSIVRDTNGDKGGAISNKGDLEFLDDVVFTGTTEGGGLYNNGNVMFSGDATFEDNNNSNNINDGGGGFFTEGFGSVTFKGAASFIGNEVEELYRTPPATTTYKGGKGGGMYVGSLSASSVVFEGPVLFSGNIGTEGAGIYVRAGEVVFEDLVTFEDNVAASVRDASSGGAMAVYYATVEFQAGVVATGNIAKNGGAFNLLTRLAEVNIEGPVTITGNEARYQGGAIWNLGEMTIPEDADISGNTAVMCPGIKNLEDWEQIIPEYARSYAFSDGSVEFTGGGSTYSGSSIDMCYLGEDVGNGPAFAVTYDSEAADCDALFGAGTTLGGYSVLTWDTRVVSEVNFDVGSGDLFDVSCASPSIIFVTGGGEVTVTSTTDSMTFTNIRFEVGGYTNLYFDVPEMTMTGLENSQIGGSTHVDKESSLEFWHDVKFLGNTLAYFTDIAWNEYGGAAVFNAGHVLFGGQAYFRGNGQFAHGGLNARNAPGGAILNVGSMEFVGKTKFWDNFSFLGGNGGGIANSGKIVFNRRTVWRNNIVAYTTAEEGQEISGGHGAALYNFGRVATTEFLSKALFRDNVGGFRGGAVGANGDGGDWSPDTEIVNKITFGHETTFKDNSFDVDRPDTGGAGLWVKYATAEFQDRVVFRRNEAMNGAAIMNGGGAVIFASSDTINMTDNVGVESCPDIKNYDKDRYYALETFGDIDDSSARCGSSGYGCSYYEGEVSIGSGDAIVGETSDICEF